MDERDLHYQYQELLQPRVYGDDHALLQRIGIDLPQRRLTNGFIRKYNEDFIVEEIHLDGKLSTVEPKGQIGKIPAPENSRATTLWFDLVKSGIPTLDAVQIISKELGAELRAIGYAGFKDDVAITSQQIAIENFPKAINELPKHPRFFAKNIQWGTGLLKQGELNGNKFTILVRTDGAVNKDFLRNELEELELNGFYNFYGEQRFGAPRFINQALGALILKGNYSEALKTFLVGASPWENRQLAEIRDQARTQYSDWRTMWQNFSSLPYPFRRECAVLEHLIKNPKDILGALNAIGAIVKLWVYSYASFAFNYALSQLVQKKREIPSTLPLITTPDWHKHQIYKPILAKHQITDIRKALSPFPHIKLARRTVPTKVELDLSAYKIVSQGVVIAFSLPKAAYATVVLRNLFTLYGGNPVPAWVQEGYVDVKAAVNQGSVTETKKVLK